MSAPIRFYTDPHSRYVRAHIPGEAGDRYMDPLAAQVMSNQFKSVWRPERRRAPKGVARQLPPMIEPPCGNRKYNFDSLLPGGCFMVYCPPDRVIKLMNSLSSCRNWQQRKSRRIGRPKRFALRSMSCGVRVWRTA